MCGPGVHRREHAVPGRLGSGAIVAVYEQNLERASTGTLHRPGDEVALAWSPDDTFAVDPARKAVTAGEADEPDDPLAVKLNSPRFTEDSC